MIEETLFSNVVRFLIGQPHNVMGTAFTAVLINVFIDLFLKKGFKASFLEGFERAFAYFAFIVIAVRLDGLFVDSLFEWEGSTQFIACLYIVGREFSKVVQYLEKRFGFSIPIITDRLEQMKGGQISPGQGWQDPSVNVDERIDRLKWELDNLEYNREAQKRKEQIGLQENDGSDS